MAEKIFFDMQSLNPHVKIICGSFKPNGTSAVVAADNTGAGWTVARGGVGIFTVTLADKYPGILSATCSVALNAVADTKAGPELCCNLTINERGQYGRKNLF